MENEEVMESVGVLDGGATSCHDGLERLDGDENGSENLGVEILDDLDLYFYDINDRLTISRMVSDSVIKGMINAVEQEAAKKIAAKELEVAVLKERLQFREVGLGQPVMQHEPESITDAMYLNFSGPCVEHYRMTESLGSLRNAAKEQVKKLKKEIDGIIRRSGSGSELVGLIGILREKECESWVGVARTLERLNMTVDTIYAQVDDVLQLSKSSKCEWQQEREFQGEIEAMVIQSSIRSVQEEFEEKFWDQSTRVCGRQSVHWLEKFDQLSSLREELDAISKSLLIPENGQLISHGSHDIDHLHRKASSNDVSSSTSFWEGNGKLEKSKTDVPEAESYAALQLKHMSQEEMVSYFNTMMTKLRRNHDSIMQEMTEKYFSLKREYLNYKNQIFSLPFKKDKELDTLRKKIPDVILKLDDILVGNEKLPAYADNAEDLSSLRERLDNLLFENRQLRDSLTDKKKEVKCLLSQVSDADDKMLHHSLAEADSLKLIGNLNSALEDAWMESSISEEVFKCVLRELSGQIKCDSEESEVEFTMLQEIYGIIFREVAHDAVTTSKCENEDSDMESLILQGLSGVIFGELIKDSEGRIKEVYSELFTANGKIKELSAAFTREKVQFGLASQDLNTLRDKASLQQTLICERTKELDLVRSKMVEAHKQIELDGIEISKLGQKLEQAILKLKEADEQNKMLLALTQKKQNDLLLVEAEEKEHRKRVEALIVIVGGLSTMLSDFECRVTEDVKNNNLRLKYSSFQLSSLTKKANDLRRSGLLYKEKHERRFADLRIAEAEVDLLGDEVDTLSSLLEKIYIALDHYSPVLQHYPGIIEILKLVRRELTGESTRYNCPS